jgi:TRAP transporter TAXI family solute receptor
MRAGSGTEVRLPARVCVAALPVVLCCACENVAGSSPRSKPVLRFGTGTALGRDFVRDFARHLPAIDLQVVNTGGSVGTIDAMRRGEVDLGIMSADVAYFAARASVDDGATEPIARGIAVTSVIPLHLVVGQALRVDSLADLRGRLVGIGPRTAAGGSVATLVMNVLNVEPRLKPRDPSLSADIPSELHDVANGTVDAALALGYDPVPEVARAVGAGARLMSIEGPEIDRLRQQYPFIRLISIPAGTYPGQTAALHTIGADTVLVCTGALDEALVYDLTAALVLTLPEHMSQKPWSGRYLDWDHVSATPIQLHPGAARYYRDQELYR